MTEHYPYHAVAESLEDQCARLQNLSTIKQGCCTHRESILATETPVRGSLSVW